MVTTRGQSNNVDGGEASVTASGNRIPRRNRQAPNLQQAFDAMQARMERTEQELLRVQAERDALMNRNEGSEDSHASRTHHSRQATEGSPTRSRTTHTYRSGTISNDDKRDEGGKNTRVFKFKSFLDCKPTEFKGSTDPVVSIRWLREIEVVFESCECPDEKKVVFASRMLKGDALDWWDTRRDALGAAYISGMTWESFRELFLKEYCTTRDQRLLEREFLALRKGDKSINEYVRLFMEKLRFCGHLCRNEEDRVSRYVEGLPTDYRGFCRRSKTLAEAIEESKLVDDDLKVRARKEIVSGSKKKSEDSSGSNKRLKDELSNKKGGKKTSNWCDRCKSHHAGPCSATTLRCNRCGIVGHLSRECTDEARCYNCQETGHLIANCPKKKDDEKKNDKPRAKARVFRMAADDA